MFRFRARLMSVTALGALACGTEVTFITPDRPSTTPNNELPEDLVPPIAECSVSADPVLPMQPVDLMGEQSYDPDGNVLISWRWELIAKPDGSSAELPAGAANREGFTPDAVGEYAATLVVTNDHGNQSDPCAVSFDVEPEHALWVELVWQYGGDDLDLHVVRGGASGPADDCFEGNCDLDWGALGIALDDPELLRTEVDGTGPELFGLIEPREDSYDIYVVDRAGSLVLRSDNIAIVTVYIDGVEAWSGFKTIQKEASTVPFARVSWPTKTVTELD
jgi:hypothetical protein